MNLKGKQLSLLSKILALVFVLICFTITIVTHIPIQINDVIKVALFIALIFTPIDVSFWLEKIFWPVHKRTIPDDGKSDSEPGALP
jgi:hypothetical protein